MIGKEAFADFYSAEEEKNHLHKEEFSTILSTAVENTLARIKSLMDNAFLQSCDDDTVDKLYRQISEREYNGSPDEKREYLSARRRINLTSFEKDKQLLMYIAGAEGEITEDRKIYIFSPLNISMDEAAERIAELLPVGCSAEIITEGECWGFLDARNLCFDEIEILWEEKNGFD